MPDSLSRTFARYVSYLHYDALPPQVVDKIKASLLHMLGCVHHWLRDQPRQGCGGADQD